MMITLEAFICWDHHCKHTSSHWLRQVATRGSTV